MNRVYYFLALIVCGAAQLQAAEREFGITATGSCIKKVSQDRAAVTLTASSLKNNASQAVSEATRIHERLRDAAKALNLKSASLDTESVYVYEDREWVDKKMVSRGYRAKIALSIESSDIGRMGEVIALGIKQGIQEVGGLKTFVSKEKFKAEYDDCLETATRNAKDKAQKLAKGAGVRLGKVMNISEGGSESSVVQNFERAALMGMEYKNMASDAVASPTIEAKTLDMTVSATVMFQVD